MKLVTNKFKSGGLHEKHVVATWNLGNHDEENVIPRGIEASAHIIIVPKGSFVRKRREQVNFI